VGGLPFGDFASDLNQVEKVETIIAFVAFHYPDASSWIDGGFNMRSLRGFVSSASLAAFSQKTVSTNFKHPPGLSSSPCRFALWAKSVTTSVKSAHPGCVAPALGSHFLKGPA
jgi:hypothetical protein